MYSKSNRSLLNLILSAAKQQSIRQQSNCMAGMEKFGLPKRLQGSTPSVWNEYIALAMQYKPLNLGQGFPDEAPPSYVMDALADIAKSENPMMQQYTRGYGHLRLVQNLGKLYSKLVGREINPLSEIIITSGAYEALYSSIMGHVDVGDEVIIIEPFFDCYEPMVKMAGGIPRFIPLKPCKTEGSISSADWVLDDTELEKIFNEKTKMIILNTPHNPIGKVFNKQELQKIADLCHKWNVLCISDEVYEWLVFDNIEHIRICTLPGMWERTITIGSAGKTFSVTGWKIGWAYGPANLITNLQMIHQNSVYTCPTPIQEAVACSFEVELGRLDSPDCYFRSLPKELKVKRDFMAKFLQDAGMKPTVPEGGYFMLADWTNLEKQININEEKDKYRDYKFTKWMTKNMGLQGIPPSAFYSEQNKNLGENFVRYCFIKKQENLEKAAELLKKLNK
ncbi:kynurenine--oxoglutarate transaminase 3 isoform X2 [Teleopsis dalmanni]|nr:kynurenine--oxoglutarate transaminase 3 isoform X2 [Teleopsis dalmanni]XP_037956046.1 kynurenine--oxoglutarate transaminase 3 isoform X2 [Teleopsis dalmanni]XP_037956047.1 kynurenine--oxoglutarate transaminase 3 isoform X2 [Teleopsis dalmanni]